MATEMDVLKELDKVVDPEVGIPMTEMGLVDVAKIENGIVTVEFHFTTPACPPVFAIKMANDIKEFCGKLDGVKDVRVKIKDHYMADQINDQINK